MAIWIGDVGFFVDSFSCDLFELVIFKFADFFLRFAYGMKDLNDPSKDMVLWIFYIFIKFAV